MKILLAVWLAASFVGILTQHRKNVIEYEKNTTGCLLDGFVDYSDTQVTLMSPVSAVASLAFLQLGYIDKTVSGLCAATAICLLYLFAERFKGLDYIAPALATASIANVAVSYLEDTHAKSNTGAVVRTFFSGTVVYVALSNGDQEMIAIAAVVPVIAVIVDRSKEINMIRTISLCGAAAATTFFSTSRDDGVCTNNVDAYAKQDYMHAFAIFLGVACVAGAVSKTFRYWQQLALSAISIACIALTAANFENGWLVLCVTSSGTLLLAEIFDELRVTSLKQFYQQNNGGFIWEITFT